MLDFFPCWDAVKGMPNCKDFVSVWKDILTLLITIVGSCAAGYYGYLRFIHGRLYSEQLVPKVTLTMSISGSHHWLVAKCEIKNAGIRRIDFRGRRSFVEISAVYPQGTAINTSYSDYVFKYCDTEIQTLAVFPNERAIDPNEIVNDSCAVLVSDLAPHGYHASFRISEQDSESGMWPSKKSWVTDDYVFIPTPAEELTNE
ncbi:MAG: hypothetical protein ABJ327_17910 [Litoreibacter sp.]